MSSFDSRFRVLAHVLVGTALAAAACGDDSTEGTGGGGGAGGATTASSTTNASSTSSTTTSASSSDSSTGDAGGLAGVEITVIDDNGGSPVANAFVALDAAGSRREGTTDEEGRVFFSEIDASEDDLFAVAWAPGYGFSAKPVDAALLAASLTIYQNPAEQVTIDGTAANMVDETDFLIVSATGNLGGLTELQGPDYQLGAVRGAEGTLLAVEYTNVSTEPGDREVTIQGWTSAPIPSLDADATVDLDFAEALPATDFSGSFGLPTPLDSQLVQTGRPYVNVYAARSSIIQGIWTTLVTNDAGDRVDFTAQYVDVEAAKFTIFTYYSPVTGEQTGASFPGIAEGDLDLDLRVPPVVDDHGPLGLGDELSWTTDDDDPNILRIVAPNGSFSFVYFKPGVRKGRIPLLPSAVNPADVFGSGPLSGFLGTCSALIPADELVGEYCERFTNGKGFPINQTGGT